MVAMLPGCVTTTIRLCWILNKHMNRACSDMSSLGWRMLAWSHQIRRCCHLAAQCVAYREHTIHKRELRRARDAALAKSHRRRLQRLLGGWRAAAARERLLQRLLFEVCTEGPHFCKALQSVSSFSADSDVV